MSQNASHRLRRSSLSLAALAATVIAASAARADLPPPPDFKYVPFELTVQGLSAAPDHVMFAYPASASNGAPTSELWVVEDGRPLQLGRRSPDPRLYLMEKAAFAAWRAAHPETRGPTNPAAAALVTSAAVVPCDAAIENEYMLPTSSPARVFEHVLELVEARPDRCVVTDVRKTEVLMPRANDGSSGDGSIARSVRPDGEDGCALTSGHAAAGGALLAAFGALLLRGRRRRSPD